MPKPASPPPRPARRSRSSACRRGVKLEKRMLKVLKAVAEYHDMTLGDLLEGIVLHAFEGKAPFERASLERIAQLQKVYSLDLEARHSHGSANGRRHERRVLAGARRALAGFVVELPVRPRLPALRARGRARLGRRAGTPSTLHPPRPRPSIARHGVYARATATTETRVDRASATSLRPESSSTRAWRPASRMGRVLRAMRAASTQARTRVTVIYALTALERGRQRRRLRAFDGQATTPSSTPGRRVKGPHAMRSATTT